MSQLDNNVVAAIVPAFNEALTIGAVVATLVASARIDEVIVVSDGSTDATASLARAAGATVYDLPRQQGKGHALLHGLATTTAGTVLFCDADLRGLTVDHIHRLLEPVLSRACRMNVGLRDRGWLLNRVTPFLPLIGGERALDRNVIEHIPPKYLSGFMIESALNYYCRSRGLVYGSELLPGLSIRRKYQKVGWKRGMIEYGKMAFQVVKAMCVVRLARAFNKF